MPVGGSIPSRGTSTLSAEIRAAAAHGFRFYVYSLSDADGVFYVGKGQRNRLLMHGKPGDTANAAKSLRMLSAGTSVERSVIAYYRDERDALDHERALIADSRDSLTNVADGGAPQDPRDRASDIAAGMLARLKPIEQIRPEFREAFCLVRAEIEREVIDPSPSSISVDARSALTFGYGETHHQSRRQTTDVGVSAR